MIKKILNKVQRIFKKQEGQTFVLVALTLSGLLAITGLAIDGGTMYVTKSHLQKSANAAVLSGAQEIFNSDIRVKGIIDEVLSMHNEFSSLANHEINKEDGYVKVVLNRTVPTSFMKIFGHKEVQVQASAKAEVLSMSRAIGVAPLGIDESIQLNYYQIYDLKVDEEGVDTGNFGILALGGTGAKTYEENLLNGYQEEIKVGDILPTQTGNIAGKTKDTVKLRLQRCPYLAGETHHRDCPRILLIPVYKPNSYKGGQNQLEDVVVTGFAYFYITEQMGHNDKSIRGMFIQRAGSGFVDAEAANKGAYAIRLGR